MPSTSGRKRGEQGERATYRYRERKEGGDGKPGREGEKMAERGRKRWYEARREEAEESGVASKESPYVNRDPRTRPPFV